MVGSIGVPRERGLAGGGSIPQERRGRERTGGGEVRVPSEKTATRLDHWSLEGVGEAVEQWATDNWARPSKNR